MAWFRKKKKTTEEAAEEQARKTFEEGLFSVRDLIAPAALALSASHLQLNDRYVRALFVLTYPQYIDTNWLTPIINFDTSFDISMHIYPVDSTNIMKLLRRKVTEMESSLRLNAERGAIRDPELEIAYQDAEELRDGLRRGLEK